MAGPLGRRAHVLDAEPHRARCREDPRHVADRPSLFVLDMFPYPSGIGLHVGHPLGYIATDVYARFQRMTGCNVLHAMGYDAFGLPAEQYAVQTGTHPRVTTEENIANMKRQMRALGLGHDPRRGPATTDVDVLPLDAVDLPADLQRLVRRRRRPRPADRASSSSELESGTRADARRPSRSTSSAAPSSASSSTRYRLAYLAEAPVNWCPGLGTVLANEEVTADGRSERGNFPVYRRPLKQWMLRITAYADRLLADLDLLDWSESIKLMQRNWIGRSTGALVRFPVEGHDDVAIEVFTTRPDTLFGATYMVLAPEHPLVDVITADEWPGDDVVDDWSSNALDAWKGISASTGPPPEAVRRYREFAEQKTELERQAEGREKTGVFTGAFAINPTNGASHPDLRRRLRADGLRHRRDHGRARHRTSATGSSRRSSTSDHPHRAAARRLRRQGVPRRRSGDQQRASSTACTSTTPSARSSSGSSEQGVGERPSPTSCATGCSAGSATGASRSRSSTTSTVRSRCPTSLLPVELPEMRDFEPDDVRRSRRVARAAARARGRLGRGRARPRRPGVGGLRRAARGRTCARPTRCRSGRDRVGTTCATSTRPTRTGSSTPRSSANGRRAPALDGTPKAGLVDLYVGGVEHAVLHLLYARFWHKVLYDLGHVSTIEPFQRLVNQGMILAAAYTDERGMYVEATEVVERDGEFFHDGEPVTREFGKMGKSLKNAVSPTTSTASTAPTRCGSTRCSWARSTRRARGTPPTSSACTGSCSGCGATSIDEETGALRVSDARPDDETLRVLHRTIAAVRDDMASMSFNTAIARLFECNNHLTQVVARDGAAPREVAEPLVLMVAPLAPHIAEELWARLGHADTLTYETFPIADPALARRGDGRGPGAGQRQGAGADQGRRPAPTRPRTRLRRAPTLRIAELLDGATVRKVIVVPGRIVNFVLA